MIKPVLRSAKLLKNIMKFKPLAKAATKIRVNKPEILAVAGGTVVVGSFIWVVVEAQKLSTVMTESEEKLHDVEEKYRVKKEEFGEGQEETPEFKQVLKEEKKEIFMARADGTWQMVKLFGGPAVGLTTGLLLMGRGHYLIRQKYIVTAATLKGTNELFKFYRENVVEAEGKDADLKYMRGIIKEVETESTTTDMDGKEVKTKKKKTFVKRNNPNPYRFLYSEDTFSSWEPDAQRNIFFLKCNEEWFQHKYDNPNTVEISMYEILQHMGYDFSCETKERMNFLRNTGYKPGYKGGDGGVDFGIYEAINEPAMKGQSEEVYFELNVDGNLCEI